MTPPTLITKNWMCIANPSLFAAGWASFSMRYPRKQPRRINWIARQPAFRSTSPKGTESSPLATVPVFWKWRADRRWNARRALMFWSRGNWRRQSRSMTRKERARRIVRMLMGLLQRFSERADVLGKSRRLRDQDDQEHDQEQEQEKEDEQTHPARSRCARKARAGPRRFQRADGRARRQDRHHGRHANPREFADDQLSPRERREDDPDGALRPAERETGREIFAATGRRLSAHADQSSGRFQSRHHREDAGRNRRRT